MGPFWAGLAAYHFLPFLRSTADRRPPGEGKCDRKARRGGSPVRYRGEGTPELRRRVAPSPLRPLLLEVALPVRRRRVFQQRRRGLAFFRLGLQS
jgi:hypothetical protein